MLILADGWRRWADAGSSWNIRARRPTPCSGLAVARYSGADLEAALATRWRMINESRELHTTPSGTIRPFTWTASVARPRQASHAACASGVLDHSWDEARRRYGAAGELLARAQASLGRSNPSTLADEVAAGAIPIDPAMSLSGGSTLPLLISYSLQSTPTFATS